jgi:hypothetical protein
MFDTSCLLVYLKLRHSNSFFVMNHICTLIHPKLYTPLNSKFGESQILFPYFGPIFSCMSNVIEEPVLDKNETALK